jgi:DNA-binding transcriptional ArsR family regulator
MNHMTPPAEEFWILDPAQIACLASAPRQTIVDRLAADGPLSVDDLARVIGMKQTAVYHHIHKLEAVGLVHPSDRRLMPGARKPQILYATPAPRMRLARALGIERLQRGTKRCAGAMLRQAERDFAEGFDNGATHDGDDRNHGFFRLIARPDAAALAEINEHLHAIGEILWRSNSSSGAPIALSWTLAPLSDESDPRTSKGKTS